MAVHRMPQSMRILDSLLGTSRTCARVRLVGMPCFRVLNITYAFVNAVRIPLALCPKGRKDSQLEDSNLVNLSGRRCQRITNTPMSRPSASVRLQGLCLIFYHFMLQQVEVGKGISPEISRDLLAYCVSRFIMPVTF